MASNLTVDTLTKGATTLNTDELVDVNNTRVCKAWVNFNGTGTVAIRDSYNVSSIADYGVADYAVNLTTAMPDINYCACVSIGANGSLGLITGSPMSSAATSIAPTTTALRVSTGNAAVGYADSPYINVAIFR